MAIKIDKPYMQESLRCFTDECLPGAGIDKPDIFIIIAAQGDDITFDSSSDNRKKTMETLQRATYLQAGDTAKLEEGE